MSEQMKATKVHKNNAVSSYVSQKIVILSFVLSILIMFMHTRNYHLYPELHPFAKGIETLISVTIGYLCTPSFFMISGFLFFRGLSSLRWREFAGIWLSKMKSRVTSLFLPYVVWNFLAFLFFFVMTRSPFRDLIMSSEVPFSVRELFDALILYKYNGVYWYMALLIIYSVTTILYFPLFRSKYSFLITPIMIVLSAFAPALRLSGFAFWSVGVYAAFQISDSFLERKSTKTSLICLLATILLILFRFLIPLPEGRIGDILFYSLLIINMITLWFAFDLIPLEKITVKWWMKITFFLYSAHPLIMDGFKKVFASVLPKTTPIALLLYFGLVPFVFLLVLIAARLLRTYLKPVWKLLSGGRG